jgi:uncharacterized protein
MAAEPTIDYEALAQDALRGVVRTVLVQAAKTGLPGEHHFYISFDTGASGVVLSKRLKDKYPSEMTIVLQHRFWDLSVSDSGFEVKLTFDGIPERLVVPFGAIKVFFDPSVPYGLQFEGTDVTVDAAHDIGPVRAEARDVVPRFGESRARKSDAQSEPPIAARVEKKQRKPRAAKGEAAKGEGAGEALKSRGRQTAGAQADGSVKEARSKVVTSKPDQADAPANDTKIIQLDKFRKK